MEAGRRNVAWYHEWPLYNPFMCGGEPQLANPQSIAGSPAFLFVALFGTAVGERLMFVCFVALGLDGMFRLSRALGADRAAALCAAIVFGLSGWVVLHFGVGHVSFFGATLIPYAILFYLRAREDRFWAIALGAVMALVVAQGGTSTAAMAALALAAVALADAVVERTAKPFVILGLGAVAALLLGAYRLLPALEFAVDHPRHVTESDAQSPLELLRAAFVWAGNGKLPGHRYAVHEYGWRISYLAWPFVLLGLRVPRLRRIALALFFVGAAIAMGDFVSHGPWWLMRHLPVLRDLRVPSRYALLCALGVALLCGAGLSPLMERLRTRRLVVCLVVAAFATEGAVYANTHLAHVFDLPPPPIGHAAFHQEKGHWSRMLEMVFANTGDIGCDEEAPLTRAAALDVGLVPQVRLDDPSAGTVSLRLQTPDRIVADVVIDRPSTLLVNLNWNEHWHSDVGEVVRFGDKWPADHDGGRLGVRLPAMHGVVTLRYRPRTFAMGLVVSLLSVAGVAFLTRRRRRDRLHS
jgi:hypothetical protein